MGVMNRRNAMLGWAVWQAVKFTAKQKARTAVPSVDVQTRRPNKPAIAAALITVVGAAILVRKLTSGGDTPSPE
jgi:hypothetical protein